MGDETADERGENPTRWKKFRRSCGNIALALMLVAFSIVICLMFALDSAWDRFLEAHFFNIYVWTKINSYGLNHFVLSYAFYTAVLSALFALVGGRYWIIPLMVLLIAILPTFAYA